MKALLMTRPGKKQISDKGMNKWPIYGRTTSMQGREYRNKELCLDPEGSAIAGTTAGSFVNTEGDFIIFRY